MVFKTTEELLEFVNTHETEIMDVLSGKLMESFKLLSEQAKKNKENKEKEEECKDCECEDCECEDEKEEEKEEKEEVKEEFVAFTTSPNSIIVESLSSAPEFKLIIKEGGENKFYVKNYQATPGTCGTGTVTLSDRTIHLNMCENDNIAKINLTVIVEGNRLTDIPFVLCKTEKDPYIVLGKIQPS